MSESIRRRLDKLERQGRFGSRVLLVLVEPGETIEQATERCCASWGLPKEAFGVRMVLDLYGSGNVP
jgi:uncharacterized membrane protein YgcG